MLNFELYNPVNYVFGKGQITKLTELVPSNTKILIAYGGGSIFKNGVYDQVTANLKGFEIVEFGGIEPNPRFETLMKAVDVIKAEKIDFILAVGGGSVIDGVKFISAAVQFEGDEADILRKRIIFKDLDKVVPFGTVLTLPATGSEMNSGYVISRRETNEKLSSGGPGLFPQFSVLDPEVIRSIPKNQIANGIADAYTHVLEQYMTAPSSADLQERIAESILISLQNAAPKVMFDEFDYDAAGNFMWCCTMALNGLIQKGVITDWAVHAMGHELTAYYGIDHARSQPGAIHRYPRWRSRCLSSMASKPAIPRTSFGKSTWHTCTYLLQVRRCFTSWFTQAKHCSSAGLLQRSRRYQEACDRNWRRSVGNCSCLCMRALRHGMRSVPGWCIF